MEDNSNHLSTLERELSLQCQSLDDICDQLITLIALSGGANPHTEVPLAVANVTEPSPSPLHTTNTHRLKPATPNEFTGNHTKGHAFPNSCDLYIGLAPTQFMDDQAKIYWVLSFMKGDCAACFMNHVM